ncbi:MAG: apolipoprotein N-acyltransferase [Pseudomonadota bacterium]|nr:apolipoprotein N-acyltransferase [Pseudomonadota bacterium]
MAYSYAFAPYNLIYLVYISLFIFFYILIVSTKEESIKLSFTYGLFLFLFGVNWIFNSIYNFGGQHLFLSLLITFLFIIILAATFVLIGFFINKPYLNLSLQKKVFVGSSIWIFSEWLRSNFFGGFPWLLLGHSQAETYLSPLYPLLGSYMVGFVVVALILYFVFALIDRKHTRESIFSILSLIIVFSLLNNINNKWITHLNNPIKFSIIQPNIKQEIKFNNDEILLIKKKYLSLIMDKKNRDLIIFPETALSTFYQNDRNFFRETINLVGSKTSILSGTFRYDEKNSKIFNSIVLVNKHEQFYDKRHLVPFGEYVPFPKIFQFFADNFSIPMSNLSKGKEIQNVLQLGNNNIYPLICYEITFPNLININQKDSGLIINISNDAWFGNSSAPSQHLQIAQIRALETQRYILRSANTGISAIIDPYGNILQKIDFDTEGTLDGTVPVSIGRTPFMDFGDYSILMLIFIFMFLIFSSKPQKDG